MKVVRKLMVVEMSVAEDDPELAVAEFEERLDAFRESVQPAMEHGVILYGASDSDVSALVLGRTSSGYIRVH